VITLEIKTVLDSSLMAPGQLMWARATEDVKDSAGRTVIPAGSSMTFIIRQSGRSGSISVLSLGLYSVSVGGRSYRLSNGDKDAATVTFTEDAGQGASHAAVHLFAGQRIDFKLGSALQLR
jgi:hypothetical protein